MTTKKVLLRNRSTMDFAFAAKSVRTRLVSQESTFKILSLTF